MTAQQKREVLVSFIKQCVADNEHRTTIIKRIIACGMSPAAAACFVQTHKHLLNA